MAQYNNATQLGGIFKDVWKESVFDPYSFMTPVMSDLGLEIGEEAGALFHVPIVMQLEHGITHAAAGTTPGVTSGSYVRPRAGVVPDARIAGVQTYLRAFISYEALMDSLTKIDGDVSKRKAVASATKVVMKSVGKSGALRGEILAIHGGSQNGLGVVEAAGSEVGSYSYEGVNGFARDIRITEAEWSSGLWMYALGATVDCFNVSATPTRQNTVANVAVLPTTSFAGIVIGVQPATLIGSLSGSNERVIRLWHSVTAGLASFATAGNAIFFESGGPLLSAMRETVGIDVLARCGSGETGSPTTIHGLDSNTYSMWGGNFVSGAGVTRLDGLMDYMNRPFNAGVMGAKYRALVPSKMFSVLASDEAALRRYDDAKVEAKTGFAKLTFTASGGNTVEIMAHPFQKDGKITCYPVDEMHRIGSQELSFLKRTSDGFVLDVADVAAGEIRAQGKYNIYADCNRHLLSINGITY